MSRPTIKDVATRAGVSPATVSLVLRNSRQIPPATQHRVRTAIDALGYVYNRRAAEMRGLSSRMLGLVVANIRNPYFAELTMAIEAAAGAAGYTVILGCSDDDTQQQGSILTALAEHQVDGIVLLPASHTTIDDLMDTQQRSVLPVVLVARIVPGYTGAYVGSDNEAAAVLVGRHLAELGVESVALIGGVAGSVPREDRRRGLLTGLGAGGPRLIADTPSGSDTAGGTTELWEAALQQGGRPDAIVAYNDMHAFRLMNAIRAGGLEPGRDIAVVSFDDVPEARLQHPGLTSVAGHPEQVGIEATQLIIEAIVSPRQSGVAEHILIRPELAVRASSRSWSRSGSMASL